MKLNIKAVMISTALIWGAIALIAGTANLIWAGYGRAFLELLASVYPGYKLSRSVGGVITCTLYAVVDGGLLGLVFAWLYNRLVGPE